MVGLDHCLRRVVTDPARINFTEVPNLKIAPLLPHSNARLLWRVDWARPGRASAHLNPEDPDLDPPLIPTASAQGLCREATNLASLPAFRGVSVEKSGNFCSLLGAPVAPRKQTDPDCRNKEPGKMKTVNTTPGRRTSRRAWNSRREIIVRGRETLREI